MNRYIALVSILTTIACGPIAAPDVSPHGKTVLAADKYVVALTDFQDALSLAFDSQWLSKGLVNDVAQALELTVKTIYSSPNGAKAAALGLVDNLRAKYTNTPEFEKFKPYLDSVYRVLESF